jgi:carbon-monoxide dehydrogenase medium subunit
MRKFEYHQPETVKEAFDIMKSLKGRARYLAGGTDVFVQIKRGTIAPGALISLRNIPSLRGIAHDKGLSLGSMTLFREIERDPRIGPEYPALRQAVSLLANPQIRNVASIGGNLCNAAPSADTAPPLMVMGAVLTLESLKGVREVPVEEFFLGPGKTSLDQGEIVTKIRIPETGARTAAAFSKVGRVAQDLALVNAAALLTVENGVCRNCRLVAGAVAPVPLRLRRSEKLLQEEKITPRLLTRLAGSVETEVRPITDIRATETYRRSVSGVLVRRAVERLLSELK